MHTVRQILVGWCTLHWLIWFSLAVLLGAATLYIFHVRWERRSWPRVPRVKKKKAPAWARKESRRHHRETHTR